MMKSVAGIIVENKKVFIAKRLPIGQMGGKWEFPGGKVENNEEPAVSLVREYKEEFGLDIIVKNFICEAEFIHFDKTVNLYAFEASFLNEKKPKELTEHSDFSWASFEELLSLDFVDSDMLLYEKVKKYFENK